MNDNIIEVDKLKLYFPIRGGILSRTVAQVHAVDNVSFKIQRGETLGLVGESGCGKTTLGRCILRLLEPTEGTIKFDGINLTELSAEELRNTRSKMSMIFQDPYSSLNPRKTVADIVGQPLEIHKIAAGREKEERVTKKLR
jgi:ABC-type microcin C transport system duplicated ATPase subunit YejF